MVLSGRIVLLLWIAALSFETHVRGQMVIEPEIVFEPLPLVNELDTSRLATGDFNEDGHLDLVGGLYAPSIRVAFGDGRGSFDTEAIVGLIADPNLLIAADMDNDGHLDLVAADRFPDRFEIVLGDGNGGFQQVQLFHENVEPEMIDVGDVDGDGALDLLSVSDGRLAVRLGLGNGRVGPVSFLTDDITRFAVADWTADGNLDFVVARNGGDEVALLVGDGAAGIKASVAWELESPNGIVAGDFDGDGHLDFAALSELGVTLFLRDGSDFVPSPLVPLEFETSRGIAGDWNDDGRDDLALERRPILTVLVVSASITPGGEMPFASVRDLCGGASVTDVCAGDYDEDGIVDLAIGNIGGHSDGYGLLTGDGEGGFRAPEAFAGSGEWIDGVVADFNADGIPDVGALDTDRGRMDVFLRDGSGGHEHRILDHGRPSGVMAVGRFDDDPFPDLIVGGAGLGVWIYRADGTGGFELIQSYLVERSATDLVVTNVNDRVDSHLDVLVAMEDAIGVRALLGRGDGTFDLGPTARVDPGPADIEVGDFNEDGHVDYVSNTGVIRFGDGFGTFPLAAQLPIDDRIAPMAIADVNVDGHLDIGIAMSEAGIDRLEVYLGDGAGGFAAPLMSSLPVQLAPTKLALVDFDHDGIPDVASGGRGDSLAALAGNGDGTFRSTSDPPTMDETLAFAAQDMNGDGAKDIVTFGRRSAIVHRNYTFLERCRRGVVNEGTGSATDVLAVNGSFGFGPERKITLRPDEALEVFMDRAPADASSPFALYAWVDRPASRFVRKLPVRAGFSCFDTPVLHPDPPRLVRIWNNTGDARLGIPDLPSTPAPSMVVSAPSGIGFEVDLTLQGILRDSGAVSPKDVSATNAVLVVCRDR